MRNAKSSRRGISEGTGPADASGGEVAAEESIAKLNSEVDRLIAKGNDEKSPQNFARRHGEASAKNLLATAVTDLL